MKLTVKEIPPTPPKPKRTFILELSEQEATVIATIFNFVGGNNNNREIIHAIKAALRKNGIYGREELIDRPNPHSGMYLTNWRLPE